MRRRADRLRSAQIRIRLGTRLESKRRTQPSSRNSDYQALPLPPADWTLDASGSQIETQQNSLKNQLDMEFSPSFR